MSLTVNHIPENWNPDDKIAFINWMQKIKSNYYHKIQ